jgi:prephenate dehydrogenase
MGGVGAHAPPGARPIHAIGIVGIGLIGGSFALAVRRARPGVRLIGVEREPALERAAAMGVFDRLGSDLAALHGADLIALSAPVRQNAAVLTELGATFPTPVLITDTGSTKRVLLEAAHALPAHVSFVGGHPLAGAARAGAEAARADLFQRRPWLLTPCEATRSLADVELVASLVSDLGAEPHVMDAEAHDHVIAFLSHLPQLTASALMHVVGNRVGARDLTLAGPGLADTTRLAASPPAIWRDICATNSDAIALALDALIDALQRLRGDLTAGEAIEEIFGSAGRWRALIESGQRIREPEVS